MFSRSFVLIFYTCLQCLDKHTWLPRSRLIWGWVIEWVGYKIFIGKEISDSNITIRRKVPKFIFNIHRCVAICMKMIRKVLLEDCIMFFFFLVFSHTGREKKVCKNPLDWSVSSWLWKITWNIINRQPNPTKLLLPFRMCLRTVLLLAEILHV